MASPSSDDDDERSHPLAHNRPGVYVQVMSPRRRKARVSTPHASAESAEQASAEETPPEQSAVGRVAVVVAEVLSVPAQSLGSVLETALDAQPKPMPMPGTSEGDSDRPSGEREIVTERPPGYARQRSENSNARGDLVVVTLPPPPRLPSFLPPGLAASETLDRASGMPASLLEAPMSLRPQEAPAARGRSWMVLAFVVALSAIVSSALLVALRDSNVAEPAMPESNALASKLHPELVTSPSAVAQPNPGTQPSLPTPSAAQRVVVTPAPATPAPAPVVAAPAAPAVAAHAAAGTAVRSTANGAAVAPVRPLGTSSLPQPPSAVPGPAAAAPAAQNVAASVSPQLQAPVRPPAPAQSANPAASSASVEQPPELPANPYND